MRLASKYHWDAVLSFHAAVWDRNEAGLANWGDDFSEIESALILLRQTVFLQNRPLQATTTPSPLQPVASGSAIIAVSGTGLAPAVTRHVNREWNTFVCTANFRITPSLRAPRSASTRASTHLTLHLPQTNPIPSPLLLPSTHIFRPGQLSLARTHSHAAVVRHILCSKLPLNVE